jgi:hypothetical protein
MPITYIDPHQRGSTSDAAAESSNTSNATWLVSSPNMRAGKTGLLSHTRILDVLQQHFRMVRATVSHIADANVTSDVVGAPHAM